MALESKHQLSLEWAVALASTVHEEGLYEELYANVRDNVGGFPGIWRYWMTLGTELAQAEEEFFAARPSEEKFDYDFILAVSTVLARVATYAEKERNLPLFHELFTKETFEELLEQAEMD